MHGLTVWVVQVDSALLVLVLMDVTQMGTELKGENTRLNDNFTNANIVIQAGMYFDKIDANSATCT